MAKTKRGKNTKKAGWRGTCPSCNRAGVKLLWSRAGEDGKSLNVCKICGK